MACDRCAYSLETPEAAREVAFMLQCEYGSCTMITVPPIHDTLTLRTAIKLTGAAFCLAGDHSPLVLSAAAEAISHASDQQTALLLRPLLLFSSLNSHIFAQHRLE